MRSLEDAIRDLRNDRDLMKQKYKIMDKYGGLYDKRYKKNVEDFLESYEYEEARDFELKTLPNTPEGKKMIWDTKKLLSDTFGRRYYDDRRGYWNWERPIYEGDS